MTEHTSTRHGRDTTAIIALVLAFIVPPAGILLAFYGGKSEEARKWSPLRTAAVVLGAIFTVLWAMALIWFGAIASSQQ